MNMMEIDKLAWLCIQDKRLLVARSKERDIFYIPGGKREKHENDQEALMREIKEELSVNIKQSTIEYVETFRAQAHDKPEGKQVKITCYFADYVGEIQASSEIEEVMWITYEDKNKCSAVTQLIIEWLKSKNLIELKSTINKELKNIKNYQWILFDADDTLFHFDAFSGLQLMFSRFNVNFTEQDYLEYQAINKPLWVSYQKNIITAQQLQIQRFDKWAKQLSRSPQELNSAFLLAMAEICKPLEGAISLLNALKGRSKLGILTNGFTELQQARLKRTGLENYFDLVVISEQVGIAKPHRGIFDHALIKMDNPSREHVLMVGDNLESDIKGGLNAELDTCWLNTDSKPNHAEITPHYQVSSLRELEHLLLERKHSAQANLWTYPTSVATPTMWRVVSTSDKTTVPAPFPIKEVATTFVPSSS